MRCAKHWPTAVPGKKLDLPPPNNLIPANFEILPKDADLSARPQLVQQWDGADLWYMKDDRFKKPKGIVACKLYTSDLHFGVAPQAALFAEVWKRVLQEYLREYAYMADCAQLSLSSTIGADNIELKWSGYNDSLLNYVEGTLEKISLLRTADVRDIFAQVKEQLAQEYRNHYYNQVFRLGYAELNTFLVSN